MENSFYLSDKEDNSVTTITQVAEPGSCHVITGIHASFSTNTIEGIITIKQNTTAVIVIYFTGEISMTGLNIKLAKGLSISAELSASGTGGKYGSLLLNGYTI